MQFRSEATASLAGAQRLLKSFAMPPPILVLSSAPKALADGVAAQIAKLGFKVDAGECGVPQRKLAAKIESAHRVVVLGSRAAWSTPALRAAMRRARTKNTLVCVGLNAAPPPAGAKSLARLPRTRAAWRSVLCAKQPVEPVKKIARPQTRPLRARRDAAQGDSSMNASATSDRRRSAPILGFLATLLVFGAAVSAGLYQTDSGFAARINSLTAQARAQVGALARH